MPASFQGVSPVQPPPPPPGMSAADVTQVEGKLPPSGAPVDCGMPQAIIGIMFYVHFIICLRAPSQRMPMQTSACCFRKSSAGEALARATPDNMSL